MCADDRTCFTPHLHPCRFTIEHFIYPNLCDGGEFNLSLLLVPKGHSEVDYLMFFKHLLLHSRIFFWLNPLFQIASQ